VGDYVSGLRRIRSSGNAWATSDAWGGGWNPRRSGLRYQAVGLNKHYPWGLVSQRQPLSSASVWLTRRAKGVPAFPFSCKAAIYLHCGRPDLYPRVGK
jgi:hypothetical protein